MNIKLYNPSKKETRLYSSIMTDVSCDDNLWDIICSGFDASCDATCGDSSCGGGCVGETGSNSVFPEIK